jgi:putative ABC transport system permease protein
MYFQVMIKGLLGRRIALCELYAFCRDTFLFYEGRFALTVLGMAIGTASLIVVVTIGLGGEKYVMNQIESIGTNWVFAEYQGGIVGPGVVPDPLTATDFDAILQQVPGVVAGSPIAEMRDQLRLLDGRTSTVHILGILPGYMRVRNLVVTSGRVLDEEDVRAHSKVTMITDTLAGRLYSSESSAIGQVLKLDGLPFTIIGTFKERFDTFGRSEVYEHTLLIPYSICRSLTGSDEVKQLYFSVANQELVPPTTKQIHALLQARHRPHSVYWVDNLTQLISAATTIEAALTLVLLLIAAVTLLISGIGITNIMLTTVLDRTREIGIRKAVGATRRDIYLQFLAEALFISVSGGVLGTLIGVAIPYLTRLFTSVDVPLSTTSVIVGLCVSAFVGIAAGMIPAIRAARMPSIESLRYE